MFIVLVEVSPAAGGILATFIHSQKSRHHHTTDVNIKAVELVDSIVTTNDANRVADSSDDDQPNQWIPTATVPSATTIGKGC